MSRLLLAASFVTVAVYSFASADRVAPIGHWAKPPIAGVANPQADVLDRAVVRTKLAANRAANLARFRAYQKAGVFPNNTYGDSARNVWLDEDGHLCAAATIIKASGKADLVARTAEQNNFIRLVDVTQGPLFDWILTSGLTKAEIVAIQEIMMPVTEQPEPDSPEPRIVDGGMRKRENQRLLGVYRRVDASIVANQQRSLELAVDRLLANPVLARQLLDG